MNIKAYGMSKHQLVIGVDGGQVTGRFIALGNLAGKDEVLIQAFDIVIWNSAEDHSSGMGFGPNDLTGWVAIDGAVRVNARGPKQDDAMYAIEAIEQAMLLAATEFRAIVAELTNAPETTGGAA